jgi:hypothetical protein
MSKKTRQEKIMADLRRRVAIVETESGVIPAPAFLAQTQSLYIYPPQLVRKDLTRTFLLTILVISLELGIYLIL